jgi:ABC-type uncharacterized transport system substrate-binding protein
MVAGMTARTLVGMAGLNLAILSAPLASEAQLPGKVPRIGIVRPGSAPDPFVDAFRQGLRELGYVEGQNVTIEYRWAEGRDERLPGLAADLVHLKVEVIVASGTQALLAKRATATIPIVMPASNDPVAEGLVSSLARPGGNVTGRAFLSVELPGKWVELLTEALPGVSRVAILWHPASEAGQLKVSEAAARSLNVRLQTLKVQRADDLATAFAAAQKSGTEASSSSRGQPSSRTGRVWSSSRPGTSCRRCITSGSTSTAWVGSCPMGQTSGTSSGAPPPTWTGSSRAPSPPISRSSSPRSSSS